MFVRIRPWPTKRHRVVSVLVDGMTSFEPAVADEFFGDDRTDLLGVPWYRYATCTPGRVAGAHRRLRRQPCARGLEALRRADTVVIAGRAEPRAGRRRPSCSTRCAGPRARRAHGVVLHRRVRAGRGGPARRPTRHHALGAHRRVPGAVPEGAASIRRCSTSTTATCSRRPARPRRSTSRCTSSSATTAPTSRTASRAISSCRRTGAAARRSSSRRRSDRPRSAATGSAPRWSGRPRTSTRS